MEAEFTAQNESWTTECSYAVKFTWNVANFSAIETHELSSDAFAGGSHKWRIVIYPEGDHDGDDRLSVFLEADLDVLCNAGSVRIKYRLSVVSEFDEQTVVLEGEDTFDYDGCNCGYALFLPLDKLNDADRGFLMNDTVKITAEVWCNREKEEALKSRGEKQKFIGFHQEQIKDTRDNSFSDKEIAEAKANYKKCLNMDVTSFIRSMKVPELKRALSLLLTAKAFPVTMVRGATKFLAHLDERCKEYEGAQRDLRDLEEEKDSVSELKANVKHLASKFTRARDQVEAIEIDLARLEELMTERKAERARLGTKLDELAEQAFNSKQALLCVERNIDTSNMKKYDADETISKFHTIWESMKDI